ncbi:adenosylcobinamide-GDP ribazoletransferase [Prauserella sp. ASG 168]|uniref:Adenosylcobinamide-GDP ribazoletransferase n=2 Tax=Prauserella cavernicola TaxID=2800127 RepID=A0A934QX58_9PSEU|nr:adenosylcobinamide-GDP ribazoletransferase [Prauserella cavernicola]
MAAGTLTALPVPAPRAVDRRVAGTAMLLAPVAAIPLAALALGVVLLGDLTGLPALVTAALAIGAVALGTRGLHLDGLTDTADGLAAAAKAALAPTADARTAHRERALEIMRRGDSGPAGIATLVLVLLVQCAALAGAVAAGHGPAAVVLGVLAGRAMLPLCCARGIPSARPGGLGDAVAGTASIPWACAGLLVVAGLSALAPGLPWWQGPAAVLGACAIAGVLLARCVRRLGGITGDVLGACVETATTTAWLVLST